VLAVLVGVGELNTSSPLRYAAGTKIESDQLN